MVTLWVLIGPDIVSVHMGGRQRVRALEEDVMMEAEVEVRQKGCKRGDAGSL